MIALLGPVATTAMDTAVVWITIAFVRAVGKGTTARSVVALMGVPDMALASTEHATASWGTRARTAYQEPARMIALGMGSALTQIASRAPAKLVGQVMTVV